MTNTSSEISQPTPVDVDNGEEGEEAFDPNAIAAELQAEEGTNRHTLRMATYLREKQELIDAGVEVNVQGPKVQGQMLRTKWKVRDDLKACNVTPFMNF